MISYPPRQYYYKKRHISYSWGEIRPHVGNAAEKDDSGTPGWEVHPVGVIKKTERSIASAIRRGIDRTRGQDGEQGRRPREALRLSQSGAAFTGHLPHGRAENPAAVQAIMQLTKINMMLCYIHSPKKSRRVAVENYAQYIAPASVRVRLRVQPSEAGN